MPSSSPTSNTVPALNGFAAACQLPAVVEWEKRMSSLSYSIDPQLIPTVDAVLSLAQEHFKRQDKIFVMDISRILTSHFERKFAEPLPSGLSQIIEMADRVIRTMVASPGAPRSLKVLLCRLHLPLLRYTLLKPSSIGIAHDPFKNLIWLIMVLTHRCEAQTHSLIETPLIEILETLDKRRLITEVDILAALQVFNLALAVAAKNRAKITQRSIEKWRGSLRMAIAGEDVDRFLETLGCQEPGTDEYRLTQDYWRPMLMHARLRVSTLDAASIDELKKAIQGFSAHVALSNIRSDESSARRARHCIDQCAALITDFGTDIRSFKSYCAQKSSIDAPIPFKRCSGSRAMIRHQPSWAGFRGILGTWYTWQEGSQRRTGLLCALDPVSRVFPLFVDVRGVEIQPLLPSLGAMDPLLLAMPITPDQQFQFVLEQIESCLRR